MDLIQRKTVPGTDRNLGTALQDSGSADSGLWIELLADIDSGSGTGFLGQVRIPARSVKTVWLVWTIGHKHIFFPGMPNFFRKSSLFPAFPWSYGHTPPYFFPYAQNSPNFWVWGKNFPFMPIVKTNHQKYTE